MNESKLTIRPAQTGDEETILSLIQGLADYEKLSNEVTATPALLRQALFNEPPAAHAVLGEWGEEVVGFALYFYTFSTFLGRPGLYLEDLYVEERSRGYGIGKALLLHLAKLAHERGCGRMEWSVLDWNQPAIEFYESLGAKPMQGWTVYRLDEKGLNALSKD